MRARLVFDEVADDYIELVEVGTRKRFGAVRRRDYFVAQGGQICRQAGTKLIAVIHDQNSASCGHALVITAKCPREELARRGEKDSRPELYDIAALCVRNILPWSNISIYRDLLHNEGESSMGFDLCGSRREDFNRMPKPLASPNRVRLSSESLIQKLENGNSSCLRSWFATVDFYALHYARHAGSNSTTFSDHWP